MLLNYLAPIIILFTLPAAGEALSMGSNGDVYTHEGVNWQPAHIDLNGHDAKVDLPGDTRAIMSSDGIYIQGTHSNSLYMMFHFDLESLNNPSSFDSFILAVGRATKNSKTTVSPVEFPQRGVVYAVEVYYDQTPAVIQRIYQTPYAIYSLIGPDNDLSRWMFESFDAR